VTGAEGPVIELRGIEKSFRSGESIVPVLRGVDLTLAPGEFSALMGPSGSGKSTLLLIAGMLEPPTAGEISLGGRPLSMATLSAKALRQIRRSKVGFVFQKPNLVDFLTARENIELVLQIAGLPARQRRSRADALLTQLDLPHRAQSLPRRLSGGEQQRVAIARALANAPSLILADEPTAALDLVRGRQALEFMRALANEHRAAVLVVTHDQRSLELFDRVLHMEEGRLRAAS
jgi:putative ABC transport system ATP-binding protein